MRHVTAFAALGFLCAGALHAQQVISARSGLIHYVEGQAALDGKNVEYKLAQFPEMKEGAELKTGDGRAEVLLTPGTVLRLAENSAVRLLSNKLSDTRLEFLSGSVMLEAAEFVKENVVSLRYQGNDLSLRKNGLYRIDSAPAQLSVYAGEVLVEAADQTATVKEGKRLPFGSVFATERFDPKTGDSFYRWTKRRAEYLAVANISAAKGLRDSERTQRSSGWFWNPYYSMYTFVPYRGSYLSPYGFRYWSPVSVYQIYAPRPVYSGGGGGMGNTNLGYRSVPQTSSGYSGTMASAASAPSPSAGSTAAAAGASAPVARESGSAGGRSR